MAKPSILVTGALGQVGNELRQLLGDRAEYVDREEMDITDREAVLKFIGVGGYRVVINCAAYTAVDKAESEEDQAHLVNVFGPANLAEASAANSALLLHISTDFVFDGKEGSGVYTEEHPVNPLSVYGKTKAEGERAVLESTARAIIIRTSWVYSFFGANFVKTMIRLGTERDTLSVIDDQTGSPTYAADLAGVLAKITEEELAGTLNAEDMGLYHYSNSGHTTWCGFARAIMKGMDIDCDVQAIPTSGYPTPAERPNWSVLDCSRIEARFSGPIPYWEDSLTKCLTLLSNSEE